MILENFESGLSDILQEAKIDVMTKSQCIDKWDSSINDGHVCVADLSTGSKGSCKLSKRLTLSEIIKLKIKKNLHCILG